MKNPASKKGWMMGMTHPQVETPQINLIKEINNDKSDKYFVKLELRRDPKLSTSYLYEFKMSLFDNGEPEDFSCLFVTST